MPKRKAIHLLLLWAAIGGMLPVTGILAVTSNEPKQDLSGIASVPSYSDAARIASEALRKEFEGAKKLCRSWLDSPKGHLLQSRNLYVIVSSGEYSCETLIDGGPAVLYESCTAC